MKFGELIRSFKSPTIDYNGLKDHVHSTANFVEVLNTEIERVDRVYERLYNVYNNLVTNLGPTTDRRQLVTDIHQLYEYGVLNLVAIEKSLKKHDKNNQTKIAAQVQEHVKTKTFLFRNLERSSLYKALPALYAATENDQFCNVCLSHVPYTIALGCKHVLCLNCSSTMSEHHLTQCPTCRTEANLHPVHIKAKEILGATPNPTFSLLEGEIQQHQHQHQHQHEGCDKAASAEPSKEPATCSRNLLPQLSLDPVALNEVAESLVGREAMASGAFSAAMQQPPAASAVDALWSSMDAMPQLNAPTAAHAEPQNDVWSAPQFMQHAGPGARHAVPHRHPQAAPQRHHHVPHGNTYAAADNLSGESRVQALFPRNVLRLSPADWKMYRQSVKGLSRNDEKVIQGLRRKELSCVYAERARQKRLHQLKDATGIIGSLKSKVASLSAENASLRKQLQQLKASVAT